MKICLSSFKSKNRLEEDFDSYNEYVKACNSLEEYYELKIFKIKDVLLEINKGISDYKTRNT